MIECLLARSSRGLMRQQEKNNDWRLLDGMSGLMGRAES